MLFHLKRLWIAALALMLVTGSGVVGQELYGLTSGNNLIRFNASSPGVISSSIGITGLAANETLLGIDVRPATGQLFGLGSGSRLYSINTSTGVATQVGSDGAFTLNGTTFGFDFNPTVDRIRVVSNNDQNLRLNPITGGLAATDTNVAYAGADANAGQNPHVAGSAYTNNFAGTNSTTLFNIDSNLAVLVTQIPPNNGTLNTIGGLGVSINTNTLVGFDITDAANNAFASLNVGANNTQLYGINLATGAATNLGVIGDGSFNVTDIAAAAVPEPSTLVLGGVAIAAAAGFGWKNMRRKLAAKKRG